MSKPAYPDGITDYHTTDGGLSRHASPISFVVLAGLLLAAALGLLGGQPHPRFHAESGMADLSVETPAVIRNGEFFETRITVVPKRPVTDLVVAVTPALWRDITVNTMIPAAADERFEDGAFHFGYGKAEAGKPVVVKIDSQINPPLFAGTRGAVIVFDGKVELVRVPIEMKVRP